LVTRDIRLIGDLLGRVYRRTTGLMPWPPATPTGAGLSSPGDLGYPVLAAWMPACVPMRSCRHRQITETIT